MLINFERQLTSMNERSLSVQLRDRTSYHYPSFGVVAIDNDLSVLYDIVVRHHFKYASFTNGHLIIHGGVFWFF